jgi:beta-aspartyl-peptidase (threonine type)
VSCTGSGEVFMRAVCAHDVAKLVEYAQLPLEAAVARVVHSTLPAMGGQGGLIALDSKGNCSLQQNTLGMYRGACRAGGEPWVAIFSEGESEMQL